MYVKPHALAILVSLDGTSMPTSKKKTRHKPNFTFKLKIIIGFLQIGTNLAFVANVPWPTYYVKFIKTFDIVRLSSFRCLRVCALLHRNPV
jgi:hypothetical protein